MENKCIRSIKVILSLMVVFPLLLSAQANYLPNIVVILTDDLSANYPDVVKKLTALYNEWLDEMADPTTGG